MHRFTSSRVEIATGIHKRVPRWQKTRTQLQKKNLALHALIKHQWTKVRSFSCPITSLSNSIDSFYTVFTQDSIDFLIVSGNGIGLLVLLSVTQIHELLREVFIPQQHFATMNWCRGRLATISGMHTLFFPRSIGYWTDFWEPRLHVVARPIPKNRMQRWGGSRINNKRVGEILPKARSFGRKRAWHELDRVGKLCLMCTNKFSLSLAVASNEKNDETDPNKIEHVYVGST